GEAPGIAVAEPVAAAVRRVDLVGEDDAAVAVEAELVFGVDEDEPVPVRDLAAAREEGEGAGGDVAPLRGGQQAALDDLRLGKLLVVRAVEGLGRRRDDGV